MKAVVCHQTNLSVADLPDPVPGPGQVLLEVTRAGICGSDLHARRHADQLADIASAVGYLDVMRPDEHVVMGHEFSGRVADYGPRTRGSWSPGTPVVSLPMIAITMKKLKSSASAGEGELRLQQRARTAGEEKDHQPGQGLPRGDHRLGLADRASQQSPRLRPAGRGIRHTSTPHFWKGAEPGETEPAYASRLAAELEALIEAEGPETVAAFIAEPVMGAGGAIVPPEGYFPAIAEVCRRHDVLMISDEVICGFGRTGEWFGAQTLAYPANSLSMAKQLTAGFLPLSAVAIDARMAEVIEANSGKIGTLGHGFTYGGHPVACAVALKTLEIYRRLDITVHVRALAPVFGAHLDRLAGHPLVGEARHLGLMGAIELAPGKSPRGFAVPGKVGPRMQSELLARGVMARAVGNSLAFCPPMVITEAEMDEMFTPVEAALDATEAWARAEGHLG